MMLEVSVSRAEKGSHNAIIHAVPTSCHCHSKVCLGVLLSDLSGWARKMAECFPHACTYTSHSSPVCFVQDNHPWHRGTAAARSTKAWIVLLVLSQDP